nr:aldo/keto reductase [Mycobacteroides abscessus]
MRISASLPERTTVEREEEGLKVIRAAAEAGITLFDTGDFYGGGHNELLVGRALKQFNRDEVTLSVKFGMLQLPGGGMSAVDSRPESIKNFLTYSLTRLGVDHIDIYRPARLDKTVPIEETVGALSELVEQGYIRHIGLSEIGATTLRRAAAIHPISDLQIEYSLIERGIETAILPAARELGVAITAYGILSHGLLSQDFLSGRTLKEPGQFMHPRFKGQAGTRNLRTAQALASVAEQHGVTLAQAATAWVMAQGSDVIPIIGSTRMTSLQESLGALQLKFSSTDLQAIEDAVPPEGIAGERHIPQQMAFFDRG